MSVYHWIVRSSADPRALSLTVKGALTTLIPLILILTGWNDADANAFVEAIANLTFYVSSIVSAAMLIAGLIRKVKLGRWSAEE